MVSPQVDQPRVKRARRNALRPNSLEIDIIREIGVTHRLGQITVGGNEATDDCDRDVETTNNIGNVSNHNNERLPLPPPPTVTTTLTTTPSLIITSAPTPVTGTPLF